MQTKALQRIGVWRRMAWSVAVIGVLLTYTGFMPEISILRGVSGILMAVLGSGAAYVIGTGYKNGKKNVERMLEAVSQG